MPKPSRSLVISRAVTIILVIMLTVGIALFPSLVSSYIRWNLIAESAFLPLMTGMVCCIAPAYIILGSLYLLLSNIRKSEVFTTFNVKLIRIISWCCFIISVIFIYLSIYFTITWLVAVAASFIGLILRVIKNVFEQAIVIKSENDLTV